MLPSTTKMALSPILLIQSSCRHSKRFTNMPQTHPQPHKPYGPQNLILMLLHHEYNIFGFKPIVPKMMKADLPNTKNTEQ